MNRRASSVRTLRDGSLWDPQVLADYLRDLDLREAERRPRVRRLSTRPGPDQLPVMER